MQVQFYFTGLTILSLAVHGYSAASAVDGGYSHWSKFSECSASCGSGLKIRKRSCNSPEPKNGGKDCSGLGPAMESEACNSFPCPIDGGYSNWSNFTECSATCGGGFQRRTRTCTNPLPCCGGKNCDDLGPTVETQECGTCKCVIDGGWSAWCSYTACSVTCGGGVRYRNRTCTNPPPQGGGQDCLGPYSESQECNTQSCHNGNFTEWSEWSKCSVTCGGGAQKRTRTCTHPPPGQGGRSCEELSLGPSAETQDCSPKPCPIDGNYTEWSEWSDCSVSCGGGKQERSRTCTNPHPKHGGQNCDDLGPANETQKCNPEPCPIDGNYTEWSEWSECSVTCDGGSQTRSRQCTNPPPQHGGRDCEELGPANGTQECNTNACPPPCSAGLDIGIVLDKSRSVKLENLQKVIASLVELVDKFEPAPNKDHFGLITFNREVVTEFTFKDETLYNREKLKKRIEEIPLTLKLQTRTDRAMKAARDNLFSPSGGDRPTNPNVMIMLTDGKPTHQSQDFSTFAADFHKDPKVADLYTVAVGIGNGINSQTLHDIAGENGSVLTVESFDQLAKELGEIKDKVCD
ncbi:coadhesin-like [Oculina patagonica]